MNALSSAKKGLLLVSTATLALTLSACASDPQSDAPEAEGAAYAATQSEDANSRCNESDNLLTNTDFATVDDWIYTQHAGELSFTVSNENAELEMARIAGEPWMMFRQKVSLPPGDEGTLRLSADLKGAVQTEPPLHAQAHISGLYLQAGSRGDQAISADHSPNSGSWDWQRVSVTVPRAPGSTYAWAGFVHQGGGSLWARNPSLVLMECAESG